MLIELFVEICVFCEAIIRLRRHGDQIIGTS